MATPQDTRIKSLEAENAELRRQLDEAYAQQQAAAEVLQAINGSPGNLAPVFDAMLEKARALGGAAFGTFMLREGERFFAGAVHGAVPEPFARLLREGFIPSPASPVGRLRAGEPFVHIPDLAATLAAAGDDPVPRTAVEVGGVRTLLMVPLLQDAELVGLFTNFRQEVRPFTDKQIALLQNFAAQAVIAMENARLITETREALDQQTAAAEVLGVINSSPGDLAPVFDAILEKAHALCGAEHGALMTYDGEFFRAAALHDMAEPLASWLRHPFRSTPGDVRERLLQGERLIHIPDIQIRDAASPENRAALDAGVRTLLIVPLRRDDALLGYITANRREVRPFTDKQIALLQNFAAQAVIAMENARLITETREALAQQTATAEVLGVINSSPGDLTPVFDAMLEKAMRLCEAAFGGLWTYGGGELFPPAALKGVPEMFVRFHNEPVHAIPGTIARAILDGSDFLHIPDMREDGGYRSGVPAKRALADEGGARSVLVVALRHENRLLGFFLTYRQEVRPFSDKQIALLQNFAAQAVIAIENARLITETREALAQQTATAEILQVINSSPGDLAPVFDAILEKAHDLCGVARGSLELYDGQNFRAVATHGLADSFADQLRQGYAASDNPATRPLIEGEPFSHIPDRAGLVFPFTRSTSGTVATGTLLCVSLRRDDRLLGMIAAARREVSPFTDKQIALLRNFAQQAVIAMENARLITETREALEQQTATAEVLQVINASPGDLAPVFDAMLEKALRLCDATYGNLLSYDGELFRVVGVVHGDGHAAAQARSRPPFQIIEGSPLCGMVEGKDLEFIEDVRETGSYRLDEQFRQMVDAGGYRSLLNVPLRKEGVLVGVIGVFRTEIRPFTDKQTALLQNFAAQAVIAMENARLITETREALEQQTATAEVLQVINASPGDLAPVFDAMLEKAMRLCEADFGFFLRYQNAKYSFAAGNGLKPAFREYLLRMDQPSSNEANAQVIRGAPYVHIVDMKIDEPYRSGAPFRRAIVDLGGGGTGLGVPMRKDHDLLGTFNLARSGVRPFTDKQIALVQNFAAQAVIAMENARLITETREALDQQQATAEVLGLINSSPGDLTPVFDAILEKAHTLCGETRGTLFLFDGEIFRAAAMHGYPSAPAGPPPPAISVSEDPRLASLAAGERLVHVPDFAKIDDPIARAVAERGGVRTNLLLPLRKDRSLLGVISCNRQEVRPFSDKDIALLENFAAQAAIAIENARLLGELRQRTEEVAELNRGLEARVAEQVDELGRVGRLKRFLAPQLAELIVSQGDENILAAHRREIVVVFCDLRGYTAFTETAEPEEVLDFLREYHGALGPLVAEYEGTLDQFSGDGIMVFFNDPVPIPDPAERAVKMAMAMREAAGKLVVAWRRRGRELGFGAGIAQGYATLGQIGFAERAGYTAIGTVCNVAARLCAEAKDGQILLSQRVAAGLDGSIAVEELGALSLKGLSQPIAAFNVPADSAAAGRLRLV